MEFTKDIHFSDNLRENETVAITYSGELFKNNSEEVTIVFGFGENWDYTTEQIMQKTDSGFTANIEIKNNFNKFNFCFRNSNYIWDNNSNSNYISVIEAPKTEEIVEEVSDTNFDEAELIKLLDNLLEQNINNENEITYSTKQQILEDILSEQVDETIPVDLIEDFDMNKLIENILEPVINTSTTFSYFDDYAEDSETISTNSAFFSESTIVENCTEPIKVVENYTEPVNFAEEPAQIEETITNSNANLVPTNSELNYLVSPRQLSRFYLIKKKIKLALYKLFVCIPKILTGEFNSSK